MTSADSVSLRERRFVCYVVSRLFSSLALQMQEVAVGWLIYDRTHSALALGLAGLAAFLPAAGLVLVTGHVADSTDRRRILLACTTVMMLAALGFWGFAAEHLRFVWPFYALIVLGGAARAFAMPAAQAFLPNLVAPGNFGSAVAWSSSASQTATVAGPAIGGLLYALGAQVVFATVAGALTISLLLIATIPPVAPSFRAERLSWNQIIGGILFIRSRTIILGAISLDLFAVLFGGATALLPIFARDILRTGPFGLGLLRSMPAAGAVSMALFLAHRTLRRRTGQRLFQAVAVFGIATVVFGLSRNLFFSLGALFVLGASDMVSVFVRQTLVQVDTPDAMRGRVSAVSSLFIGASNELGGFESGALAALVGAVPAVVLGGLATLAVVWLWRAWFPALRDRDHLVQIDQAG